MMVLHADEGRAVLPKRLQRASDLRGIRRQAPHAGVQARHHPEGTLACDGTAATDSKAKHAGRGEPLPPEREREFLHNLLEVKSIQIPRRAEAVAQS